MRLLPGLALLTTMTVALSTPAVSAATLSVGTGKQYTTIQAAMAVAVPGDVVEVQGDETYAGTIMFSSEQSGTATNPITVRGILVNGHRPLLRGIGPGQWDNAIVFFNANHFVMESFEVEGNRNDTDYCLVHMADDVTLRDFVVHDCLHQGGLVGNDNDSGSLILEYSEFFRNGGGETNHQIYMATDQVAFPHSVFRMQYCYVHDGVGGNNVKSRAERNEIYYNWIEGAYYHELDLIGPDVGDAETAREDSDVVGNVLIKTSTWRIARIGGDGSGNTAGRYRFVNNTMVLGSAAKTAITLQETVDSLEMYNNVLAASDGTYEVYDVAEQIGPDAALFGSNNWVQTGTTGIPAPWTATTTGSDPGWVDAVAFDFRPSASSPLIDQGAATTATTGAFAFPSPLLLPSFSPPQRRLLSVGAAQSRKIVDAPDLGAFEQNAAAPDESPATNYDTPDLSKSSAAEEGCGCRTAPSRHRGVPATLLFLLAGLCIARRARFSHFGAPNGHKEA
jgi:hypothetical protein